MIFIFTERKLLVRKETKLATTTDKYGKHVKTQRLYFIIIMTFSLKKTPKIIFNHLFIYLFFAAFTVLKTDKELREENKGKS